MISFRESRRDLAASLPRPIPSTVSSRPAISWLNSTAFREANSSLVFPVIATSSSDIAATAFFTRSAPKSLENASRTLSMFAPMLSSDTESISERRSASPLASMPASFRVSEKLPKTLPTFISSKRDVRTSTWAAASRTFPVTGSHASLKFSVKAVACFTPSCTPCHRVIAPAMAANPMFTGLKIAPTTPPMMFFTPWPSLPRADWTRGTCVLSILFSSEEISTRPEDRTSMIFLPPGRLLRLLPRLLTP